MAVDVDLHSRTMHSIPLARFVVSFRRMVLFPRPSYRQIGAEQRNSHDCRDDNPDLPAKEIRIAEFDFVVGVLLACGDGAGSEAALVSYLSYCRCGWEGRSTVTF
jgi:hypothetical protein